MTQVRVITLSEDEASARIDRAVREAVRAALRVQEEAVNEFNRRAYLLKEWITPQEASDYLGGYWSAETVRRYAAQGRIPAARHGQLVMIHRQGLEDMLSEGMIERKSDQASEPTENKSA